MTDDREPLKLYGVVHLVKVTPLDDTKWPYRLDVEPQDGALLTEQEAGQLAEYFRPDGGLTATAAQVRMALAAIEIPLMREFQPIELVERIAKALGVALPTTDGKTS